MQRSTPQETAACGCPPMLGRSRAQCSPRLWGLALLCTNKQFGHSFHAPVPRCPQIPTCSSRFGMRQVTPNPTSSRLVKAKALVALETF